VSSQLSQKKKKKTSINEKVIFGKILFVITLPLTNSLPQFKAKNKIAHSYFN
jgi:hypothetical protein